ncbi:hypothetical protein ACLKA7_014044 [Drosophila subpalustris]
MAKADAATGQPTPPEKATQTRSHIRNGVVYHSAHHYHHTAPQCTTVRTNTSTASLSPFEFRGRRHHHHHHQQHQHHINIKSWTFL